MYSQEAVVNNQVGLHARPATFFIQKANEFKSAIWVEKDERKVNHDENTLKDLDTLQVLLMGVSTDNGLKLTDTIIVGSYDPKTQKASLLSIPRDTFVGKNIKTGGGSDKINALYQSGGAEKTLEAVNEITGLDLKYYMVIDNQALIKLVDVIGGVEFEVPYVPGGMVYDDPTQDLQDVYTRQEFHYIVL